jgi:hypothetical protein
MGANQHKFQKPAEFSGSQQEFIEGVIQRKQPTSIMLITALAECYDTNILVVTDKGKFHCCHMFPMNLYPAIILLCV